MNSNAVSIDGRTFTFEVPIADALPIGTYVSIDVDADRSYLGQVLDEAVVDRTEPDGSRVRVLSGSGNLLERATVFGAARVTPATHERVAAHFERSIGSNASVELGEMLLGVGGQPAADAVDAIPARLHAGGFGRHTFLCGQSGSGKTYTLGIVIERLLLATDIRLVVFDPNSDFVNMNSLMSATETGMSDEAHDALDARYSGIADRIHVFGGDSAHQPLRAWFSKLTAEQQTMVLGLDPVGRPGEYNAFVRIRQQMGERDYTVHDVLAEARSSFSDDQRRLGMHIENLGVTDLSIWADAEHPGIGDTLEDDWRMLVLDLGSLASQRESAIAAAGLLGLLWELRRLRQPVILVIDEAHNICPQHPTSPSQALATEHLIRIAGEGRKFGLYIVLSTQRPDKVHQNVLSQCDNLIMMRMNSAADIHALSETFSFAPRALIAQAAGFGLGEGLAVGKIAPDPLLFKSGRRYTREGGGDVPSTWARGSG